MVIYGYLLKRAQGVQSWYYFLDLVNKIIPYPDVVVAAQLQVINFACINMKLGKAIVCLNRLSRKLRDTN
jgi:hypothetical protein